MPQESGAYHAYYLALHHARLAGRVSASAPAAFAMLRCAATEPPDGARRSAAEFASIVCTRLTVTVGAPRYARCKHPRGGAHGARGVRRDYSAARHRREVSNPPNSYKSSEPSVSHAAAFSVAGCARAHPHHGSVLPVPQRCGAAAPRVVKLHRNIIRSVLLYTAVRYRKYYRHSLH